MSDEHERNAVCEPLSVDSGLCAGEGALRDAVGDLELVDANLRKIHQALIEAPREGTLIAAVDLALATLTQDVAAAILKLGTALLEGRYGVRSCELERERVTRRRV